MKLFVFLGLFCILLGVSPVKAATQIGSEQCFNCHDDKKESWPKNPHVSTEAACEACHGPGSDHQEKMDKKSILNPASLKEEEVNKLCGGCHFKKKGKLNARLWQESVHAQMGLSCLTCHHPHKVENPKLLLKEKVKLVCYRCHADRKPIFEKTPHGQKGLQCSDCHLPHGSGNKFLLRDKGKKVFFCQVCHAEEPHHFLTDSNSSQMKELNCNSCHSLHIKEKKYLKYKKEELCIHCHKSIF